MSPPRPPERQADNPVFRRQTAVWLMAFGLFAFLLVVALREAAPDLETLRSAGPDAFSRSAIGHGAFVETLERLGIPVEIGRFRTVRSTTPEDLLVVAVPPDPASLGTVMDTWIRDRESAGGLLLVLPKWQGRRDRNQPRWLSAMELLPERRVLPTLRLATIAATGANDGSLARPARVEWSISAFGADKPDIDQPQLLTDTVLETVVGGTTGALIARGVIAGRRLWVLADPDLIDNQGLGRGDNAIVAVRLIEMALPAGGRVVFDATVHGFERPPSLWRALFDLPFLPATLAGLVLVALLVWTANRRFGAPLPSPQVTRGGTARLIASSGSLLQRGGHGGGALAAYADTLARDVERRLHLPAGLTDAGRDAWLDRLAARRKATVDGPATLRRAAELAKRRYPGAARLAATARELQRWRREMIDGSGRGSDAV